MENNEKCFIDCHQGIIDSGKCDCVRQPELDYFQSEIELTRKLFDLEQILDFQMKHDVQIIRGADWQYECYIDKACTNVALTPMMALVLGVHFYNQKKV